TIEPAGSIVVAPGLRGIGIGETERRIHAPAAEGIGIVVPFDSYRQVPLESEAPSSPVAGCQRGINFERRELEIRAALVIEAILDQRNHQGRRIGSREDSYVVL